LTENHRFLLVKSTRTPICKSKRTLMPQGSVIGNHHEIELVRRMYAHPSFSFR
jgi:hypothetical protein